MSDLTALLVLAAVGWLWWETNRARETARAAARQACERAGVQFLDETVAGRRLRLRRNERGVLAFWREYGFEFTHGGARRHRGRVELFAGRVQAVELEPFEL